MEEFIKIRGARENNLKNVNLDIPREKIVVFTGVSGSGKTTLAFDTIFAEGQRRYVESLSSYARMFLGQTSKPDVDSIDGLSPTVSIDQKTTSANPRSTVGTVTEIYDYIRLLYANIGTPFCPNCNEPIEAMSIDEITSKILDLKEGTKILIKAPAVRGQKGTHAKLFDSLRKSGFSRVEVDGNMYTLDEEIVLDKNQKHSISVVVDRLVIKNDIKSRLTGSVETALKLADGILLLSEINADKSETETMFSTKHSCKNCGLTLPEITPRLFSFNSPFGACPRCSGLGIFPTCDPAKFVKPNLSVNKGALNVPGYSLPASMVRLTFEALARKFDFSLDVPYKNLPDKIQHILLYGSKEPINIKGATFSGNQKDYVTEFEGIVNLVNRRYKETTSTWAREEYHRLMTEEVCPLCHGLRLSREALSVRVNGLNIAEFTAMSINKAKQFLENLKLTGERKKISAPILKEIFARLQFLTDVGLSYLTLDRQSGTLSGGESQRIRLATQIGSGLTGVIYILDEPSIGLHQRDNARLIGTLKHLKELGNSLIVVEHDEDTMREADYIVDVGPNAGVHGGEIVAAGSIDDIIASPKSITGKYLSGEIKIEVPPYRRKKSDGYLEVQGAFQNNLKNINVKIPAGTLTLVTGVSGGGKSSLVNEIIYPALSNRLNKSNLPEGKYKAIYGVDNFDKCINIDQSPIGRTPRSNPATYTGVWTFIRELFAATVESKERGYNSSRFSFNVTGGRCEACQGDGLKKIEMYFLPDVYVPCEVCHGARYNSETLEVHYKGKTIADVLDMTVEEALKFFENISSIKTKLQALYDVGLGYIKLGQSATTLSGGEAQRVKLATELSKRSTGKTFYILDEPTTGLHFADVHKLINILNRLVDGGNTVLVIEHNLDVIKMADYIIDLGPEGGDEGGTVVATGTPEEIAECEKSYTGQFLKKLL